MLCIIWHSYLLMVGAVYECGVVGDVVVSGDEINSKIVTLSK